MRMIDADALFDKALEIWGFEADEDETNIFMEAINEAPTIDAELVKHGEWKREKELPWIRCSVCRNGAFAEYGYCPNCGAKMDLEVKDNA